MVRDDQRGCGAVKSGRWVGGGDNMFILVVTGHPGKTMTVFNILLSYIVFIVDILTMNCIPALIIREELF